MITSPILELEKVSAFRGTNRVFQDLSLRIPSGESTAILGPNGAGKSTLLKLMAREIYPNEGTVKIFGQQRWNVWELRQRLGLVSADLQNDYSPTASGWAVVLSGFHSSNNIFGHQKFNPSMLGYARNLLSQLGIEDLAERPFAKMSTGQQRRFLLARALVNQPEVLILDEPTTGLDLPAQFTYFETMRSLMRAGTNMVLVTHHIQEILPEINRVIMLKNGKVMINDVKEVVLTSTRLSELYQTPIKVIRSDDYFHVIPA